jgi:lipoprotein-releasing system ATP-binding protein
MSDDAPVQPSAEPADPPDPGAGEVIMQARGVTREFEVGTSRLGVLKGIDLDIARGEMLVILGRSGAGKSTLLHILGLLDTPTAGEISFNGASLVGLNVERQSTVRNQSFGFVFQFYHLLPEFTALENVLMPCMIRNGPVGYLRSRKRLRTRAADLLADMGLGDRLKHRPAQLSGGERQRVAIARALINDPEIVFCDEPTGNLDSRTAEEIHGRLRELNRTQAQTFVIVTHNERLMSLGSRRLWMTDGRISDEPANGKPPAAASV